MRRQMQQLSLYKEHLRLTHTNKNAADRWISTTNLSISSSLSVKDVSYCIFPHSKRDCRGSGLKAFSLEGWAWLLKVTREQHSMFCFYRANGKLLMLYQGFFKHSNFLSSQLDQTGLSVSILDRDPHQSKNTGSRRLVICRYLVGT